MPQTGKPPSEYLCLSLFGRCGAMFLHSLFDDHPALSTIHGIAPYRTLSAACQSFPWNQPADEQAQWLTDVFAPAYTNPYFQRTAGLDRLGNSGDIHLTLDRESFRGHAALLFRENSMTSIHEVSEVLHHAFARSQGLPSREKVFLHLHTILPGHSQQILASLPRKRSILLVRDPVEVVESLANFFLYSSTKPGVDRLAKFWTFIVGMLMFQAGPAWLEPDGIAVRLEDIKRNPQETLSRLSQALGIDFTPSMLVSTVYGMRYRTPASKRNPTISGFQMPQAAPDSYHLSERDRILFRTLFSGMGRFMGYPDYAGINWPPVLAMLKGGPTDYELDYMNVLGKPFEEWNDNNNYINTRKWIYQTLKLTNIGQSGLNCHRITLTPSNHTHDNNQRKFDTT